MRLGEVRLVQHGAARACYQPITGAAWQSWGLGEEGEEEETLFTITAHAQCSSDEGGVVRLVCAYMQRGGMKRGSGWVGV